MTDHAGEIPAADVDLSAAVAAAQQGDEEAFQRVYRSAQPLLLRYLRVLVGDDAEDVASETWLQIVRDLRSFHGDYDGFRGWAATIARHRAMDHLRRQRRRPHEVMPIEHLSDTANGQDAAALAVDSIATQAAITLIAGLPQDQAEAVMLRVVMGLDSKTAGQVLGKRAGTVRTAAHRGLNRLGQRLRATDTSHSPGSEVDSSAPNAQSVEKPVTPPGPPTLRNAR